MLYEIYRLTLMFCLIGLVTDGYVTNSSIYRTVFPQKVRAWFNTRNLDSERIKNFFLANLAILIIFEIIPNRDWVVDRLMFKAGVVLWIIYCVGFLAYITLPKPLIKDFGESVFGRLMFWLNSHKYIMPNILVLAWFFYYTPTSLREVQLILYDAEVYRTPPEYLVKATRMTFDKFLFRYSLLLVLIYDAGLLLNRYLPEYWKERFLASERGKTWLRFKRQKVSLYSLIFLISMVVVGLFPSVFALYYPADGDWGSGTLLPAAAYPAAPSWEHPCGTDELGRDIFSMMIMGVRPSLMVGLIAVSIAISIGTIVGAIAGYYGGRIDNLIMGITDLFLVLPMLVLILVFASIYGGDLYMVMFIIGITSWMTTDRLVRAEFLSLRESQFVEAARTLGASDKRIIFKHMLPNALSPVIVAAALLMAVAIIIEAFLSFIGLGDPRLITLGKILDNALNYIFTGHWWYATFPGLLITLLVCAFNLVGDGLRDAMDPRLRSK